MCKPNMEQQVCGGSGSREEDCSVVMDPEVVPRAEKVTATPTLATDANSYIQLYPVITSYNQL